MAESFDDFQKRNKELFFLLFMFQMYLEQVKKRFANVYAARLDLLLKEFVLYINAVRYQSLDGFRKSELRHFIFHLKQAEANFYSIYVQELIAQLEVFVGVDQEIHTKIFEYIFGATVADAETGREHDSHAGPRAATDPEALWAKIKSAPIGAIGQYPVEMANDMALTHIKKTGMIATRAYTNGWDKPKLIAEFQKQFGVYQNQATALTGTLIQNSHAFTALAVSSIFLGSYMWCSILDAHTTDFCIEHNGNIYAVGRGPIPPGHWGCRAHTMPVDPAQTVVELPTAAAYIGTLPVTIQEMIRGISATQVLTDAELRAKILSLFRS